MCACIDVYSYTIKFKDMKDDIINAMLAALKCALSDSQKADIVSALSLVLNDYQIQKLLTSAEKVKADNEVLLAMFLNSKKVEGCSDSSIKYYRSTILKLLAHIDKGVAEVTTNEIREYLSEFKETHNCSKVTIDNIRRIFSSFFSWLEEEDYIPKNPVRRIHKVRTETLIKEVISDESMEVLRDSCNEIRDLAMVDLLASTGMRVGELVKMNIADLDLQERQCVVFGKGGKEREVYFNARTKIHLQNYIASRNDDDPALFVSLSSPHKRLTINGVETRIRTLGKRMNLAKIHPHKFRRTLATMAIDRGMPIEQVQRLLGHVKIDTTLHYAMVNQVNVKNSHRKYIG